jgi:enolase
MSRIKELSALEILDSRGRPTVEAACELVGGAQARASVPSGASTGAAEAHECRDGDPRRYNGMGCRRAAENVCGEIREALIQRDFSTQLELDTALIGLDGTPHKSRLGANAILAVSIAFARAQALEHGLPLYQHFAAMLGEPIRHLPRLTINLFSGGKHAGGQVSIQDVLMVPIAASSIDESLVNASAVYQAAVTLINRKYGMRWLTADEGGLAPPAHSVEALLDDAIEAISAAGLIPGKDICLALDVASTHFYDDGQYHLDRQSLSSSKMIERVETWIDNYPIVSIEDALAEEDWEHWPLLRERLGKRAWILGDDLLCTNPQRIRRAIERNAANALLLKVNQIGTLSEALDALRLARSANWNVTVSVRSGETEDNWFSDLAVGWSGDHVKAGSLTQSERLAKYNRLLAIEAESELSIASGRQKSTTH